MFKKIYQYVSLSNERETIQKIIDKAYGNIILDLEDTVENKYVALNTLGLLRDNPNIDIHIRIHDKSSLDYISNTLLSIKEIFVPKVTSIDEILNLRLKYPNYKYITMIECKLSILKLIDIVKVSDGIHFGYFDYCLSENIFPIEFKDEFKKLQHEIYIECLNSNKKFISSPVKDTSVIKRNFNILHHFNVSIVRHNQLKNLIPEYYYALDLIGKYESNRDIFVKNELSFISPQEYKLAKSLVESYHNL